jgi:hypothetical protein
LREFIDAEIAAFEEADRPTAEAREIAEQIDQFSQQSAVPSR